MTITCSECGCPYENNLDYCPECGNPTERRNINETGLTNCPNCGAPVTNNVACEYCGSAFPKEVPQKVIINNTTTNINNETSQSDGTNTAIGVGTAAFLGGIVGSLFD